MSSTNINKYQIIYYIVYYSKDILENAKPIITGTKAEAKKDALTHHLLTKEMFDTIEIFSNLLQLPRNAFDFIKVSYDDLFKITNHSHNIIHIPQYMVDSIIASFQFYYRDISTAGIVIYDPRTFEEANKLKNYLDPILGSVSYDEFKKCKPREIWKLVRDHFDYQNREQILIPSFDNFLKGSDLNGLPGFYYTMQNDDFDSFEKNLRRAKNKFEYTIRVLDDYNLRIKAMEASIGKFNKSKKQNKEIYKKEINDRQNINYKPLVLTVPGISNYQKRHLRAININEMNEIEIAAIKNLGLYRAMSRNAAYIEFKFIKQELFSILFNLEEHCLGRINNLFVWRSLKKIGNIIAKNITDLELNLLLNSKQISYFSDYPIDIAILPGTTSPLKCYTSISGKSLTPLSRQYQLEFTGVKSILIEDRCKVIIAECLNEEDNIRKFSDIGWDFIEKNNGQNKHIDFVFKNTNSVHKLKKFINENRDADILVISAHGHYDHARKITGIVVGDEFWDANDNDFYVPKIVIFSSCHVSSKGIGAINISDLFFRNGAICSIGTLIPIDVNKNIKLMSRLFVYITEALEAEDETSFDMIWTHVVSTNAILEILESSKKLHKWAMTRINGISPLEKFMLNHSKIQLNPKHIYRDSIKRLIEISKKDGKENHIKSVIKSQGIFPESVFYLLTGNPELISFCNSMSKKS